MPGKAQRSAIWLPQYAFEHQYSEHRFRRLQAGYVSVFRSMPEVALPDDPSWVADPFRSKTWRLYYHSLNWLLAYTWGVDNSDESALNQLRDRVESYLRANVFDDAQDEMAWDDHATADRLAVLTYLWDPYLASTMDAAQFLSAVKVHAERIVEFYKSRRWISSNHGLFHALALLGASVVFELPELSRTGTDYLREVLTTIIEPNEGVSMEQSVFYHQFALDMVRSIEPVIGEHCPELMPLIDSLPSRMASFLRCIKTPTNFLPAIGDTRFGQRTDISGAETWDRLTLYPNSGYAVLREDATVAVFVFHPKRVSHGHFDALSITLHVNGTDVLIDSGGPYSYGDSLRFSYFMASRAHNVVLLDGKDHTAPARLVAHGEYWVTAEHSGYEDQIVRRTVALVDQTLVIFDSTLGQKRTTFHTLWHYPPGTTVQTQMCNDTITTTVTIGQRPFKVYTHARMALSCRVVQGSLHPPQGWVTPDLGQKIPAPVQIIFGRSDNLHSVTVFAEDGVDCFVGSDEARVWAQINGKRIGLGADGRLEEFA